MSLAEVRAGVVTIVSAVSGVSNVWAEQPNSVDAAGAPAEREVDGRTHFWIVSARPLAGDGGIGYIDPRVAIVVDGWLGVARDGADEPSDGPAAALFASVLSTMEDPATDYPTSALELEGVEFDGPRVETPPKGLAVVRCHHARITATYVYQE